MYLIFFYSYAADDCYSFVVEYDIVNEVLIRDKDMSIHLEINRKDNDEYIKNIIDVLDNSAKPIKIDSKLTKQKLVRICISKNRDNPLYDATLLCYVNNVKHKLTSSKAIINIEARLK